MKISIEAEPKEIAALVSSLQERRSVEKTVELYPDNFNSVLAEAIRDMHEESQEINDCDVPHLSIGTVIMLIMALIAGATCVIAIIVLIKQLLK